MFALNLDKMFDMELYHYSLQFRIKILIGDSIEDQ